jgi:hypothetical protein
MITTGIPFCVAVDWAPQRCVVNRRQNNAAHSLGNELLNDLDLLRRVVFVQRALPYHLHASFSCAFTRSRFDRFPKHVGRALGNHSDWIHGEKGLWRIGPSFRTVYILVRKALKEAMPTLAPD